MPTLVDQKIESTITVSLVVNGLGPIVQHKTRLRLEQVLDVWFVEDVRELLAGANSCDSASADIDATFTSPAKKQAPMRRLEAKWIPKEFFAKFRGFALSVYTTGGRWYWEVDSPETKHQGKTKFGRAISAMRAAERFVNLREALSIREKVGKTGMGRLGGTKAVSAGKISSVNPSLLHLRQR